MKKFHLIFITLFFSTTLSIAFTEVCLRFLGFEALGPKPTKERQFAGNETLGWDIKHGVFRNKDVVQTYWRGARRATAHFQQNQIDKKYLINIYGGSYFSGEGVTDNQTFSWILNDKINDTFIQNFSVNGYGTVQAYLKLKDYFAQGQKKPDLVIYGFGAFHHERNVNAKSWILALETLRRHESYSPPFFRMKNDDLVFHPAKLIKAWPLERHSVTLKLVKDLWLTWGAQKTSGYPEIITQKIILRMQKEVMKNKSVFLVVYIGNSLNNDYQAFFEANGINNVNCHIENWQADATLNNGGHPGSKVHKFWSECVGSKILDLKASAVGAPDDLS